MTTNDYTDAARENIMRLLAGDWRFILKNGAVALVFLSAFDFLNDLEWRLMDWIIDHQLLVHSVWLNKIFGDN